MEKRLVRAEARRQYIRTALHTHAEPVSASALARELGVSRQVIVGDVALLRAAGEQILSTPRGYLCEGEERAGRIYTLACVHTPSQMEQELETITSYGGEVLDVTVSHPLYGQISAPLNLRTVQEARAFVQAAADRDAALLSDLTGGVHLHRVRCAYEAQYRKILAALDAIHMLYHGEA